MSDRREKLVAKSGATQWPVLRRFIVAERRFGNRMAKRRSTAVLYEFLRFGMKQAWACLFGGIMVFLIVATFLYYPRAPRSTATTFFSWRPCRSRSCC
ncbi:hypothetical protein A7A08_02392 [Methyloligella halotolerans]|uniref:Uncharacterized protein n=1 Tax=Methyloligella halotolerans TaxID=1177755 RepID=A0A1E2RWM3_9HYPH|nr:hypothetical protein A7A08_02392 [Methyloligella halotolerans]